MSGESEFDEEQLARDVARAVGEAEEPPVWRVLLQGLQWFMIIVCPTMAVVLPGGPGNGPGWMALAAVYTAVPLMLIFQTATCVLTMLASRFLEPRRVLRRTAKVLCAYYVAVMVTGLLFPDADDAQDYPSPIALLLGGGEVSLSLAEVLGWVARAMVIITMCLLLAAFLSAFADLNKASEAAYLSRHGLSAKRPARQDRDQDRDPAAVGRKVLGGEHEPTTSEVPELPQASEDTAGCAGAEESGCASISPTMQEVEGREQY